LKKPSNAAFETATNGESTEDSIAFQLSKQDLVPLAEDALICTSEDRDLLRKIDEMSKNSESQSLTALLLQKIEDFAHRLPVIDVSGLPSFNELAAEFVEDISKVWHTCDTRLREFIAQVEPRIGKAKRFYESSALSSLDSLNEAFSSHVRKYPKTLSFVSHMLVAILFFAAGRRSLPGNPEINEPACNQTYSLNACSIEA
jgi:hypothetical protein